MCSDTERSLAGAGIDRTQLSVVGDSDPDITVDQLIMQYTYIYVFFVQLILVIPFLMIG